MFCRRILGIENQQNVNMAELTRGNKWRKVGVLIKSYLGNSLHLLGSLSETAMTAFALRRLRPSIVFLGPYTKIQRRYLKHALSVFGSADNAPRLQARQLRQSRGFDCAFIRTFFVTCRPVSCYTMRMVRTAAEWQRAAAHGSTFTKHD